jgi:hypothetical protein
MTALALFIAGLLIGFELGMCRAIIVVERICKEREREL